MLKKLFLSFIIKTVVVAYSFGQIITDSQNNSAKVIDEIVAQVGDNIVLRSDIEAQKIQITSQGQAVTEEISCSILEELLYQNLLLNQAKLDSIEVTDGQVNAEMENRLRTIEQQIGSRQKLEEFYGKTYTQIKEEFREIIRDRMLSQEMERQITEGIEVSPEDVEDFFKSIPKDSIPYVNEKIAIQQIVVYPEISQESKNEVIEQLREWRDDILSGNRSFSAVATVHSQDPGSRRQGGKIEATRGMMVKPFEAAAFALKVGEISDVVETQYGYHIIKLLDRKGDDYTIQHILLSPEVDSEALSAAAALIDECYSRLMKHEITWEQAVKQYSEDDDTKQNQGNLSNPYTGDQYWDVSQINQIDPEIFGVVNGLNEGEVSQPSIFTDQQERKEGVRIVRIKDRTEPHVANMKEDYNFIKKAAENDKKAEKIEEWVNSSIGNTYIRISKKLQDCIFQYDWI